VWVTNTVAQAGKLIAGAKDMQCVHAQRRPQLFEITLATPPGTARRGCLAWPTPPDSDTDKHIMQ
jgi:hypothetical protein